MPLEKIKLKSARKKNVKMVNRVLKSHRGSSIDEFRVCFELDKRFKCDIDGWMDFAFSKRVKRLKLDFTSCRFDMSYTFPHERLICSGVSSLMSLTLIRLHVKSELLQHFITNCPLLERLHVDSSKDLVNLKVCSSSLKLNYLYIVDCSEFKSIEIFAPNLEYFGYVGLPVTYAFVPLSSYLHQLQSLTLNIVMFYDVRTLNSFAHMFIRFYENVEFPKFQMLNNLRHLKWIVFAYDGKSLVSLIPLIEAAPFLHHHEQVSILWRNGGQSSPEGSQLIQFFQSLKVFYSVLCNYYCFSVCGFVENGGFLRFFVILDCWVLFVVLHSFLCYYFFFFQSEIHLYMYLVVCAMVEVYIL
ncbi:FBD-associated F-box protein At4g10400-like [Fagus crenata]